MKIKLNILFLTDGIAPFVTGGMQSFATTMVKSLVKRGHRVTLVHCGHTGETSFNKNYEAVFTPEELKQIYPVFIPFLAMGSLPGHYIKENRAYSKRIKNYINHSLADYDFVYANGLVAFSFFKNKENVPVMINLHGFEMYQKAPNLKVKLTHYILRPAIKESVTKTDFVLSFGGEIDNILKNLGVSKSKIIQQSNGLKKSWITTNKASNQNITTFTFIGRNERRKGIKELSDALKSLVKTDLKFKINFIGPIPKDSQINHSSINYLGEIKDSNSIKNYLDNSDFLICPSYAEGMPTVILEAMARGNAIIATDVGATNKLIKNNGWLIEASPKSILEALKKAITLPKNDLRFLKEASVNHVKENFIYENFIDLQIKTIIQKLQL